MGKGSTGRGAKVKRLERAARESLRIEHDDLELGPLRVVPREVRLHATAQGSNGTIPRAWRGVAWAWASRRARRTCTKSKVCDARAQRVHEGSHNADGLHARRRGMGAHESAQQTNQAPSPHTEHRPRSTSASASTVATATATQACIGQLHGHVRAWRSYPAEELPGRAREHVDDASAPPRILGPVLARLEAAVGCVERLVDVGEVLQVEPDLATRRRQQALACGRRQVATGGGGGGSRAAARVS